MNMETQDRQPLQPGALVAGLILLVLGAGLLLDTSGVTHIRVERLIGPLIMISIGVLTLLNQSVACTSRPRRGDRRQTSTGGLWLIGVGAWLMASQTHVFGLTFSTSWPMLVIGSGLLIVIRGLR